MIYMLTDRYRIEKEIGAGGMGTVYLGTDTLTNQLVAIKHLKSSTLSADALERFRREGEALRDLNHPNIVRMLDTIEEHGSQYLIMEYVAGGDLAYLLRQGKPPLETCLRLAIDLADALTRAHKLNIIHRDLKPANILLAEDGTLRLTDFGVAQIGSETRVTEVGKIVGTLDYLAPEAFNGGMIDHRADIWAFGVILVEMLIGKRLFTGEAVTQTIYNIVSSELPDLVALAPDAPTALLDLIYRMLTRNPQARIPSVRIIGAELEAIQQRRDVVTRAAMKIGRFDTPPLLNLSKHNLPLQTTPFVGRDDELRQIAQYFVQPGLRLLTIVGQGGMGKTRLMLEAAHQLMGVNDLLPEPPPFYDDGVYFVELAPLTTPESIVNAIADALDYQFESADRSPRQQLLNFLRPKHMGLLLDNFEHLLDGVGIVSDILRTAPHIRIMVTSRECLNISGETIFHLEGMDFPEWETPENALRYSAVTLFMQGGRRVYPSFDLKDDNVKYVARICKLAQGLPLAIILAASWMAVLSVREIAEEMSKNIDFLESSARDVPERHRSIRTVFDYSWNLMSEPEKQVFMKLSVFRGGFTRETAEAIAGSNLRILMALVNKSLIYRNVGSGRYEIHELLRQYGEEQLQQAQETEAVQESHALFYAQFLQMRWEDLKGRRQLAALGEIDMELDNIRVAWMWLVNHDCHKELGLAASSFRFYQEIRSRQNEAVELFEQATKHHGSIPYTDPTNGSMGQLLAGLALFKYNLGLLHEATQVAAEAIARLQLVQDPESLMIAIYSLAKASLDLEATLETLPMFEESIQTARQINNPWMLGHSLHSTAHTLYWAGRLTQARLAAQESLDCASSTGDLHVGGLAAMILARIAYDEQHYEDAEQQCLKALRCFERLRKAWTITEACIILGRIALKTGRDHEAKLYYERSIILISKMGIDFDTSLNILRSIEDIYRVQNPILSVELLSILFHHPRCDERIRIWAEPTNNALKAALDPQIYQQAWERGRQLSLDDAISLVLKELQA